MVPLVPACLNFWSPKRIPPGQIPQLAFTIPWSRLACYEAPPSQSSPNSTTFICLPWPLFSGEEDFVDAAIFLLYLYLPRLSLSFSFFYSHQISLNRILAHKQELGFKPSSAIESCGPGHIIFSFLA